MFKRKFLSVLLLLACHPIFAQQFNAEEGFMVNNTNDTIRGHIKDWSDLSEKIQFKPANAIDFREYTPLEIKAFRYSEGYFRAVKVTDTTSQKFMMCLAEGRLTLYRYKEVYFIRKDDGAFIKLEKRDVAEGGQIRKDNKYIGILNYLMADCPKLKNSVEKVKFSAVSLSKLVGEYNDYISPDSKNAIFIGQYKVRPRFGIRLGMNYGSLDYISDDAQLSRYDFESRTGFTGGVFLSIPLFKQKIWLQPEVLVTQKGAVYEGALSPYSEGKVDIRYTYLQFPLSVCYFLPVKGMRPFFSFGGVYGVALSKEATVTSQSNTTDLDTTDDEIGFRGGGGLALPFGKNHKIGLEYLFERTLGNRTYVTQKFRQHTHAISVRLDF